MTAWQVGMHGSGLAHCIWMPVDGVVIEITEPTGNLKTFRNLCKWAGKTYIAFSKTTRKGKVSTADEGALQRVLDVAFVITGSYYNRLVGGKGGAAHPL